jgi:phosphopantetheine adenylyltransferase
MPGERFSFISSSIIKNIVAARGDASEFVTEEVNRNLKRKLLPRK